MDSTVDYYEVASSEGCRQWIVQGTVYCSAVGSEDCDWCPCRENIGKKVTNVPEALSDD